MRPGLTKGCRANDDDEEKEEDDVDDKNQPRHSNSGKKIL
jgi:hypothetical protein